MGGVNNDVEINGRASPVEHNMTFWQEMIRKHIVGTRKKLGEELSEIHDSNGRKMKLDEVVAYALDFERD